jgi:hypothetical protein
MRKLLLSSLVALAASVAAAQSPGPLPQMPLPVERPPAPEAGSIEMNRTGAPGKATASRLATDTATIVALDVASRTLTLKRRSGQTQTIRVGPDVARLSEFAVGDVIRVDYQQTLELEYQAPGTKAVPMESGVTVNRNDRDQAPGISESAGAQGTVTVTAIDAAARLVSFQEPGGNVYQVKAGPTIRLENLKVGDHLLATYVETVAVNLVMVAQGNRR